MLFRHVCIYYKICLVFYTYVYTNLCQVACIPFYGSVLLVLHIVSIYYFQCPGMVVVQVGSGLEKGSEFYIYHILCSRSVVVRHF